MIKIYTRTGDTGDTSLLGGLRVRKDNPRIETIGGIDEANAALGVVRAELARGGKAAPNGCDELLATIQHRLFDVGAELAAPAGTAHATPSLDETDIALLESEIDRLEAGLQPLRNFILPGGSAVASQLHWARCVCRCAERHLVALATIEPIRSQLIQYVNRLSDLLFVLARAANATAGVPDVAWEQKKNKP